MPNFDLVLKNGRVVNPVNKLDEVTDVAIKGNKIIRIECDIDPHKTKKMIDVSGKVVIPGVIDPHCHIKNNGHRNMAKVGVVTAVDVAASMKDVAQKITDLE
jgi:dihydroorotase-like cyclic amidohydrolase